ncbi:MAG TPA: ArsC family reductase [Noviherbaspirillum sp.]|jgi:arsenate reductase|uniref:ArsC family reductase n=1 Tax=Noviherbaspirillum sp. TaxID=1926288 RepID=UPI002F953D37
MAIILYGIPNCDTVKKARTWLEQQGIAYRFHDFKKAGLDAATVEAWLGQLDWTLLVNRKGTTWRALDEARKAGVTDAGSAAALMLESPSVIKRPVLRLPDSTHVGFSEALYQQIFRQQP